MDNASIVAFNGLDRIRKRPCVVCGGDGLTGMVNTIKALLDVFVVEGIQGCSSGDGCFRRGCSHSAR